jgi:hypothetical protein
MKAKLVILSIVVFSITSLRINAQQGKFQTIFIFNFYKQMEWPSDYKGKDFIIGVLGTSEITPMLEKLTVSKSGKTNFIISKFASLNTITKCNMLYIPSEQSQQFEAVQKKLSGTSTLIITEKPGLGGKGSAINFVEINGRLKFELNQSALAKARIQVSDMLKSLAIII